MVETRNCFEFIFNLTKLLGAFPVSKNGNKITFQWYSFNTLRFFAFLLLFLTHVLCNIYENELGYGVLF